jgi:hypothetical protein
MRKTTVFPILLIAMASAGFASTSYSLPGGQQDSGNNPVSASAILSLSLVGSTEVLTVTVENNTVNQSSDGENITGIELNINSHITGGSLVSSYAPIDLIDITSKTAVGTLGPGAMSNWNSSTSLSELTLTTIGSGPPSYGIIGFPGSGGVYSNANGSLTNNASKQPYAQEEAVFTVDLTGSNITLSSISGVEIGFGTQGNNYINASVVTNIATPEPGTAWFVVTGISMICLDTWRKRRKGAIAVKSQANAGV